MLHVLDHELCTEIIRQGMQTTDNDMSFPDRFQFVHGGAAYDATLLDSKVSPAPETGVCCLCQQSLLVLGRDYYLITYPSIFHVHADCAMAAASAGHGDDERSCGAGQHHYCYYPPPPSPYGGWRPPMQNFSYSRPAQYCNQPYYPPPPPPMNYSYPPSSYCCQPPPAPEHRNRSSSVTGILKKVAVAATELLFDQL